MADINIQEYVDKALEVLKDSPEQIKSLLGNVNLDDIKKVIDKDEKLGKEDLDKVVKELQNNETVKKVLAEVGNIDTSKLGEEAEKVLGEAEKVGEGLLEKAKDLFEKK